MIEKLYCALDKDYLYHDMFSQLYGWDGYKDKSDPDEAKERLRKAVKKSAPTYARYQFQLGVAYLNNWITRNKWESVRKAVECFELSARQDCPEGLLALGYCHEMGIGKYPKDRQKKLEKYKMAAEKGNIVALYRLALDEYDNGGVTPDYNKIEEYIRGINGYKPAEELLQKVREERNRHEIIKALITAGYSEKNNTELMSVISSLGKEVKQLKEIIVESNLEPHLMERLDSIEKRIIGQDPKNSEEWKKLSANVSLCSQEIIELKKDIENNHSETMAELSMLKKAMFDATDRIWNEVLAVRTDIAEYAELKAEADTALSKLDETALEEEEKYLSLIFGEYWRNPRYLCDDSCEALISAQALMRYGSAVGIKSYAGIIIYVVGVLELETRRRFHDEFFAYLGKAGKKIEDMPAVLTKEKGEYDLVKGDYTLGNIKYLLDKPDEELNAELNGFEMRGKTRDPKRLTDIQKVWLNNFLDKVLLSEDAKSYMARKETSNKKKGKDNKTGKPLGNANKIFNNYKLNNSSLPFTTAVVKINRKYRIDSAHAKKNMEEKDARECCEMLGIYISAETCLKLKNDKEAEKELVNVGGLLKQLFWLTKPLEVGNSNS